MSLDTLLNEALYNDQFIAEDAIYIEASTTETAIRVVPEYDAALLLGGAEIGVRGSTMAFMMRKSELAFTPRKGEHIEHEGTTYRIDASPSQVPDSPQEWLIHVVA